MKRGYDHYLQSLEIAFEVVDDDFLTCMFFFFLFSSFTFLLFSFASTIFIFLCCMLCGFGVDSINFGVGKTKEGGDGVY